MDLNGALVLQSLQERSALTSAEAGQGLSRAHSATRKQQAYPHRSVAGKGLQKNADLGSRHIGGVVNKKGSETHLSAVKLSFDARPGRSHLVGQGHALPLLLITEAGGRDCGVTATLPTPCARSDLPKSKRRKESTLLGRTAAIVGPEICPTSSAVRKSQCTSTSNIWGGEEDETFHMRPLVAFWLYPYYLRRACWPWPWPAAAHPTTASTSAGAPKGQPVVVGAIVSTTGPASALGEQEAKALSLMETQVNAQGGVLGRPLKIVVLDDKSDANQAVTDANQLISQNKVVALIGSTSSPATLAIKPISQKQGLPLMALAAANTITDQAPIDWIWRVPAKDSVAVARALTYISQNMKLTKIAILHDSKRLWLLRRSRDRKDGGELRPERGGQRVLRHHGHRSHRPAHQDPGGQSPSPRASGAPTPVRPSPPRT